MAVITTANYQTVIASLYETLEALDTSDYQWDPSDAWRRAVLSDSATAHLESWFFIGDATEFNRHTIKHDASLVSAMRFNPTDDGLSLARVHAAARDVVEALRTWQPISTEIVGALPTGYTVDLASPEWAVVTFDFTLTIPRG